jgi:hypothetical protein
MRREDTTAGQDGRVAAGTLTRYNWCLAPILTCTA